MKQFLSEVERSTTLLDVNVAAGAARPVWSRFRNVVLVLLVVATALLAIGYVNIQMNLKSIRESSSRERATYEEREFIILKAIQERVDANTQHLTVLRGVREN